jgi:hypothetical protein
MWSVSAGVMLALSLLALWSWPKFFGVDTPSDLRLGGGSDRRRLA